MTDDIKQNDPAVKPPVDRDSEFYRAMLKDGLDHMLAAAEEINQYTLDRIRKVPEDYFTAVLLPIVRAWVRKEPTADIGLWLNIADGLNNPIHVLDKNGQLLFILPPPFVDVPIRVDAPDGHRFVTPHDVVGHQVDMLRNGDARGVMGIERELAEIYSPRPDLAARADSIVHLIAIYQHYLLPLEELLGAEADRIINKFRGQFPNGSLGSPAGAAVVDDNGSEEEYVY